MSAPEVAGNAPSLGRALAFGLAWAVGAWQARTYGIWPAVGITAVLLGVTGLFLDGPSLRATLRLDRRVLATGLGFGAAMTAATYVAYPILEGIAPGMRSEVAVLYVAFGKPGLGLVLVCLPAIILCEEIVWRGVVFEALQARFSGLVTILLGSGLYALAHAPIGSLALVFACICVGVCWNTLRWWTGSLAAAVLAHLLWNLIVLILFPLR